MDRESQHRLSFINNQSTSQIYQGIFELSYLNTGDQQSHIETTHRKLVIDHKWLSQTQFKEVLDLCWNLPGPTTVQIIITIVTLKLKSVCAGFTAFLIYNAPAWIILTLLGLLTNLFINGSEQKSKNISLIFMGFNAAAAGIMVRNFISYFKQNYSNISTLIIIFVTAIIFYQYRSIGSIIFCLGLGAVVSLYLQIDEVRKKMSSKSQDLFRSINLHFIFGKPSFYCLIFIFFGLWVYFSIYTDSKYVYAFGFYFVGCFIIGPIDTIFAYFLGILLPLGHLNLTQIWLGIPISFMLPGTHLNVGIYFGSMIDGVQGALLSAVFLYLPCFLSLYGILPQWRYYRDKQGIQRLFQGIICVATGLHLSMILLILNHCAMIDLSSSVCIFLISTFLNYFLNQYSFLIIILGGFLAFMRRIGLQCYRQMTYCPFPFTL